MSQATKHSMVESRALMTNSTHFKENTNSKKFVLKYIKEKEKFYIDELEAVVIKNREAHGKN